MSGQNLIASLGYLVDGTMTEPSVRGVSGE
jgi:hypothetical protein